MAGLESDTPAPTAITLHGTSRVLEISFADGQRFEMSFEFLRVYSPSAEVRGHGPGQEILQVGKRTVDVQSIEPVGHYAIKPVFSDGHDSGIYSWAYLYELGSRRDALWQEYLNRLELAGASREPLADGGAFKAISRGGCA
ncbi:MAG TPA: DUF971 domain-containing protein [Burkholderiaceae bacterium]|nr:DUF971 domain-containing protein [Burkholderiaceae bacterium]